MRVAALLGSNVCGVVVSNPPRSPNPPLLTVIRQEDLWALVLSFWKAIPGSRSRWPAGSLLTSIPCKLTRSQDELRERIARNRPEVVILASSPGV